MRHVARDGGQRGTILLVVVFIATAIAALAAISSGRVVSEGRLQKSMEDETRAYNEAFAQIHRAMNVVTNSAYDAENRNLALRASIDDGLFGGTVGLGATAKEAYDAALKEKWLADPEGVVHGFVEGTEVRVYRARDYIRRLQALKGETPTAIDPFGASDSYFVLEAAGRSRDTVRLVSALVRENEPFSSFVFFQNLHTLGVSGAPRGLIHANDKIDFYFPNGRYVDALSAVNGFGYQAGATAQNTQAMSANPSAAPINLEAVDFDQLRAKADLYVGEPGLDAEITLLATGQVRVRPHTPPRYDLVTVTTTSQQLVGYTTETVTVQQNVQVGTQTVTYQEQVISGYTTETYTVSVPVYEDRTETYTVQEPVYEWQTVTRTRQVRVFVPYTGDGADGGTTVGGGGGVAGEYVWVTESYETQEQVIVGYTTETRTRTVRVQVGTTTETRTRQVPVYTTVTRTREDPVYQLQDVQVTRQVPVYETVSNTYRQYQYTGPTYLTTQTLQLPDGTGATMYVDHRVTRLSGDLNGRLTIVSNEKVRITGNVRYVDDAGRTAMLNGSNYLLPYERNSAYRGDSILGVIARDDIVFASALPTQAEVNGTLMSVNGRVGIDGFWIKLDGTPTKNRWEVLNEMGLLQEIAYDDFGGYYDAEDAYNQVRDYRTRTFVKDSLRRIGGVISNNRILETYIRPRSDGTSYVDSGFKRGSMKFDINLLFNPPPNFVQVPRPVLAYYAPVFFVRNNES